MRSKDNAGNWSSPSSDYLVVFDPNGPGITGRAHTLVPSLTSGDTLPGLVSSGQTDSATYAFTVGYNSSGLLDSHSDLKFDYITGTNCNKPTASNCHSFHLDATSFAWSVINGTNNSHGLFQGSASLSVDGTTTTNPFRVDGVDGDLLGGGSQDHFLLTVYATGANPNTAAPIYKASGNVGIGNGIKVR
jgi:hypothetical protein